MKSISTAQELKDGNLNKILNSNCNLRRSQLLMAGMKAFKPMFKQLHPPVINSSTKKRKRETIESLFDTQKIE
jgi:hypothetical protein